MSNEVRARKLADRIKVIAAETLERRVKDPRLGVVTVTDVRVTGDLREATVFYTVFGDEEQRVSSATARPPRRSRSSRTRSPTARATSSPCWRRHVLPTRRWPKQRARRPTPVRPTRTVIGTMTSRASGTSGTSGTSRVSRTSPARE